MNDERPEQLEMRILVLAPRTMHARPPSGPWQERSDRWRELRLATPKPSSARGQLVGSSGLTRIRSSQSVPYRVSRPGANRGRSTVDRSRGSERMRPARWSAMPGVLRALRLGPAGACGLPSPFAPHRRRDILPSRSCAHPATASALFAKPFAIETIGQCQQVARPASNRGTVKKAISHQPCDTDVTVAAYSHRICRSAWTVLAPPSWLSVCSYSQFE